MNVTRKSVAGSYIPFPGPEAASEDGLIAVGGNLSIKRLLDAYSKGIFPWYNEGQAILWWTPNPRYVLYTDELRVSRSLKKSLRNQGFCVSVNTRFSEVIQRCRSTDRGDRHSESWITNEMQNAYLKLHKLGFAHSVETRLDGELVGGLYGVSLGRMFYGESMFHAYKDASKVALYYLVQLLQSWQFPMIDCQLPSEHLIGLGAVPIQRDRFLSEVAEAVALPAPDDAWQSHTTNSLQLS